jgi:hypothetical protein
MKYFSAGARGDQGEARFIEDFGQLGITIRRTPSSARPALVLGARQFEEPVKTDD